MLPLSRSPHGASAPPSPTSLLSLAATALLLLLPLHAAPAHGKATLSLFLPATQVLPAPQTLSPATTHAQLTNANTTLTAPLRRSGRFVFADVPAGSYLCDVFAHEYVFVPMRVDVDDGNDASDAAITVWQTFRGNEWANTGELLGSAGKKSAAAAAATESATGKRDVALEVQIGVLAQRGFYEKRAGFNPMSLLKNPMILIGVLALAMMFGMPKLLENMDPEMREEFERQQANSPLAGLAGGMAGVGGGGPNLDVASWMAGAGKKEGDAKPVAKASGAEGGSSGGSKKRR